MRRRNDPRRLPLLVALIFAAAAAAQQPPTFSAVTQLVVLHATVLDRHKNFVPNLGRNNFKILENGVEQQLKEFKREDVPVSVGILVDNSGSMREKRAKVNAAALVFVKSSNPQDEVFIVNFNDEAFLDKDFTSNVEELKEGLEKIDSRGGTAFYDALIMSLDHVRDRGRKAKKAILLVTDGVDNASRYTLEQAVRVAHESEAVIYTVGLLTEERGREAKRAKRALEALSEASGGVAFFPDNLDQVEAIAGKIAHDIRNQYVLAYTPSNTAEDGSFRAIKVTATAPGQDRLTVRTRTGYYASKPKGVAARPSTNSP
jgi:VWFA-related protein